MTLVEVLVASIILLVTMIPMGMLLTSASSAAVQTRQRQAALQLADSWIEILSNSQPPTHNDGSVITNTPRSPVAPAGTQTPPSTLAGTTYTVSAAYVQNFVDGVGQSDFCSAGQPPSPSHPGVIGLKVVVSWGGTTKRSISITTDINYPKPGLQTEGFLAVNLTNDGEADVHGNVSTDRLQSIPVTITQVSGSPVLVPSSFTLYADGNGCIFAQVPVGTYTVAAQQPTSGTPVTFTGYSGTPPFVSTSGATSELVTNQTVDVTAETTVQLDAFDEGIIGKTSYGGASAIDAGVQCPAVTILTCVTTGSGPTGAVAAWGGAGAGWTAASLASGTHLNQVACTTSGTPTCVGVGYGSGGGVIVAAPSTFSAPTYDTVPAGVTDLTQVVCPSGRGCYALGTTAAGPVLLAGFVNYSGGDVWSVVAPPSVTFASLGSIACPTSSTCELSYLAPGAIPGVLRIDGDPDGLASNPSWMPTFTQDILAPDITSVGTIACPSAGMCLATGTGDVASPSDPTVVEVPIAGSGASTWDNESTFPTGASSVTGISCTPVTCVAIGSATGAPAVWTDGLSSDPDNWSQANSIPTSVTAVTSVACGAPAASDAADCVIGAITPSLTSSGQLLVGSLTNGGWAWNFASLPAGVIVQFVDSVACANPALGSATCAAVAATPGGPVVLASASGPSGGWADRTPASLPGATVVGIPLETAPSGTTSWTTQVTAGHPTNATLLPNVLYPQAGGYGLVAGDCPSEATSTSTTSLAALPGGTATATVPLGLLPIQLVDSTGAPVPGATITLTTQSCPSGNDAYNLPVTDATGTTLTSVPYGTYTYTVTVGGSATAHTSVTITVGASSVQVADGASTVTTSLPGVSQVQA
ncbi:MAG TPA: carboxypeptidase-like regulatory domain-containing protein [Acidimicrobiales bacterium]|nr:carboxypeptidase-like regulatory domain-containing protein [Acidimicrobiales bacterium]